MDTLSLIVHGFSVAVEPQNLLYVVTGCLLGTLIGVMPGIGPAAAIGLLIPVTYGIEPTSALIMMAGVYYGAMYGGSTTSILINTPGEAGSVMTALDGYQLAKAGRAGAALAVSAIGSFVAGTFGIVGLSVLAVPLSKFALAFGPAEYFCLMLFAMAAVSSLAGESLAKGLFAMILGLLLATVGIDLQSGQPRFTLGIIELQEGVDFLIVVVGMFAIAEVLTSLADHMTGKSEVIRLKGKLFLTKEEWRRSIWPIIRGTVLGFFKGTLPGGGATIATILSYTIEKKLSPTPEKFGTGMIEGVAGPESANNSAACGAMVPLLALGVPGSATTAIMLGAFVMYGIQPGPMLFQQQPDLVWGLISSMYIGNVVLLLLNLPLIGLFVRILYIPTGILLSLILVISTIGVYTINNSIFDVFLAIIFGVVGVFFRKAEIPTAPLVLALVLGGIMEQSFRQSLTLSSGNPSILFESWVCVGFIVLAVVVLLLPVFAAVKRARTPEVPA